MFLNRIFPIIYYLCLYVFSMSLQFESLKKCKDGTTNNDTASWKYKKRSYTRSENLLRLKCNDQILIRACGTSTGHWIPNKIDCKEIKQNNKIRPDELLKFRLHHNEILCLKISRTIQPYNERFCYGSHKIIPMDLSKRDISKVLQFLLKRKNITEYWLPIRRENAFKPFVVRLPGKSWKNVINENLIKSVNKSDEHCLKHAFFKENTFKHFLFTENCMTPLNIVCVFRSDLSLCSKRFGAGVHSPNECYGIDSEKSVDEHLKKQYLTRRNLFKTILSKYVLKMKKRNFCIIHNFYDNFGNKCISLSNTYNMVHHVHESLHWFPSLVKNYIGSTSSTEIQIVLKMEERRHQLTLVIYNRNYLFKINKNDSGVKCFTYTSYGILRNAKAAITWENEDQSHSIFQVSLVSNYSSEYWCEGHSIFDFQLVTTRKLVVSKNYGHDFVIRWKVSCIYPNRFDGLCEISRIGPIQMVNIVWNLLKKRKYVSVFDKLKVHKIRVMNIKWKPNKFFVYWIHITAELERKEKYIIFEELRKSDLFKNFVNNSSNHIKDALEALNTYRTINWTIRNTEYCYPERVYPKTVMENHWMETRRGEKGTTKILCLQHNGMPYTRLCQGDFLRGAYWKKLTQPQFCHSTKNITNTLMDIYNSKFLMSAPEKFLKKMIDVIEKNKIVLVAADVHIISNIIEITFKGLISSNYKISKTNTSTVTWNNPICEIINAYNSVTDIKTQILRMSSKLNSTNKLLESFEQSIDTLSTMSLSNDKMTGGKDSFIFNNEIIDYQDIGVSVIISKNLLYFLINPNIANVSGIALFSKKSSKELSQKFKRSLMNENYRFLQSDHDISDFFDEPNLQLGVYLPKDLLSHLKTFLDLSKANYKSVPLIVIKVYSNDKLFQQTTRNKTISSRIISISVPGYSTNLPIPISLIIQRNKRHKLGSSDSCYYWNYGNWATDGITMINISEMIKNDIVMCSLRHLSHYAYLVGHKGSSEGATEREFHDDILNMIIIGGCVIIFAGMCCIFLTVSKNGLFI